LAVPTDTTADNAGQSAAMAIAQAVTAGTRAAEEDQVSDARLIADINLQKSLLESSPELRQRFNESLKAKPNTITISQFSNEFWSSRVHLLRAHAIEKSQRQGAYNVLSEIKTKDGKLNLSREQIQLIFKQHPLVTRVYNALTPRPFNETDFWSKFFASKLFKKLKGEKLTEMDADIPEMDKYLTADEDAGRTRQFVASHIPRFIDIEGNEQNHSQRKGNAPDFTLRPNSLDKVPILRVLNNMSEQMMGNVEPADEEMFAPVGQLDEEEFRQLQDKFLENTAEDNRIALKIKDQQRFFSGQRQPERRPSKAIKPKAVLRDIDKDLHTPRPLFTEFDEAEEQRATTASQRITQTLRQRAEHLAAGTQTAANLSAAATSAALLTHNTTVEFLHYFWAVFLSGDDARAAELQSLAGALEKALERAAAVAADAETERQAALERLRRRADDVAARTGKRRRVDTAGVVGGAEVVEGVLRATVRAVRFADAEYKRVLKEQLAQQGLAGG